jgi:hypothetical protein
MQSDQLKFEQAIERKLSFAQIFDQSICARTNKIHGPYTDFWNVTQFGL